MVVKLPVQQVKYFAGGLLAIYSCGDGYVGRWYLFVAHGTVVATFTILSLFADFFPLYHPYIILISLEIFFVLLVIILVDVVLIYHNKRQSCH